MIDATVEGTIHYIGEIQEFGGGFRKRLVVIDNGRMYGNLIPVHITRDKVNDVDSAEIGDKATATVELRGNAWQGRPGRFFADNEVQTLVFSKPAPSEQEQHQPPPPEFPAQDDDIGF